MDPFGLAAGGNQRISDEILRIIQDNWWEFSKGFVIDGAGGGLIAAWEIAKDPRAFVASLRDTIDMLVNDPGGFLGGIRDEFLASLTDPRALGALTFDAVLTATGAGAAYTSISRSGKVLKLIDKVRALDKRMGGNRGAALNPFAKGALSRGNRGRGGGAASAKQGADRSDLFRVVDDVELADIEATVAFRTAPGQFEGKQFVGNLEDAQTLREKFLDFFGGNQTIVRAEAPQSVLDNASRVPFSDISNGTAITVPKNALHTIKPKL